jgi:RimJ/RimL family protein N-acetyltransferase
MVALALDSLTWPRRTARLAIRPATREDLRRVFAYRSREDVARWMTHRPTDEDAFVEEHGTPERLPLTLVVERRSDGLLVGDLYLHGEDAWAQREVAERAAGVQAEIGYVLDPEHGGQGYATEAVTALVELALSPVPDGLGLRRVHAELFADNGPSARLLERVGLRLEGRGRQDSLHRDGRWLDGASYALLADEWAARPGAAAPLRRPGG